MTVEEFNAAIATEEGKQIVEKVVAELFPHLPKSTRERGACCEKDKHE